MKKILASILIAVVVLGMAVSLVACDLFNKDDGNKLPEINLSADMSEDAVKAELAKVQNFTMIVDLDEGVKQILKADLKKSSRVLTDNNGTQSDYMFTGIIDNRFYGMTFEDGVHYSIVDLVGFDVDYDDLFEEYGFTDYFYELLEEFNYDDCKIVDGTIIADNVTFKDFNKTEVGLPDGFDTYKTKDATFEILEFEDSGDATCTLTDIGLYLNSLTVPETHDGKTVDTIDIDSMRVEKLTIGKNITTIKTPRIICYDTIEIVYLGTKAEWEENVRVIDRYGDNLTTMGNVTITCSDGVLGK